VGLFPTTPVANITKRVRQKNGGESWEANVERRFAQRDYLANKEGEERPQETSPQEYLQMRDSLGGGRTGICGYGLRARKAGVGSTRERRVTSRQ